MVDLRGQGPGWRIGGDHHRRQRSVLRKQGLRGLVIQGFINGRCLYHSLFKSQVTSTGFSKGH